MSEGHTDTQHTQLWLLGIRAVSQSSGLITPSIVTSSGSRSALDCLLVRGEKKKKATAASPPTRNTRRVWLADHHRHPREPMERERPRHDELPICRHRRRRRPHGLSSPSRLSAELDADPWLGSPCYDVGRVCLSSVGRSVGRSIDRARMDPSFISDGISLARARLEPRYRSKRLLADEMDACPALKSLLLCILASFIIGTRPSPPRLLTSRDAVQLCDLLFVPGGNARRSAAMPMPLPHSALRQVWA